MSDKLATEPLAGAQRLKRWLRPLMLALTVVFVAVTAHDLWGRWDGRSVRVEPAFAVLALLPTLVGAFLQGLAWILLVERMATRRTPRWAALALYLDSQLARYTPGKVGLPLIRMEGAPRLGLPRRLVGVSVLLEMLSWTATGAVVGFLLLVWLGAPGGGLSGLAGRFAPYLLGASLLALLGLVLVDRRGLSPSRQISLGLEGSGAIVPLRLPLLQLLYWVSWAVHGYFLARALGADPRAALSTMGFSPLANVLGFVALAAPAGVGVREAVMVAGLSPVLGGPGAVAAAILARVLSLASDVLVWAGVRAVCARPQRAP